MRVIVLSPKEWEQFLPRDATNPVARASGSVVHYLHERHIGISPDLARELASVSRGSGGSVWDAALDQMSAVLVAGEAHAGRTAALWRAMPLFALTSRLAAPLLQRACESVGITVLFGRLALRDSRAPFDQSDYSGYVKDLRAAAVDLIDGSGGMGTPFWRDCAESLFGAAARLGGREVAPGPLGFPAGMSDIDRILLTFLSELKPVFTGIGRRPSLLRRRMVRSEAERIGTRPKEGGVSGVRFSHSADDFDTMLLSEFLSPKALMADKLLNQGFLVRHRPPIQRPRWDALIVGIVPHSDCCDSDRLVKAAWIDAAFRTAIILKRSGFGRSELRWIERSGLVGYRCTRIDLQAVTVPFGDDPWQYDGDNVLAFFRQAQWMPGVLDRLPADTMAVPAARSNAKVANGDPLAVLVPWVRAAFARSWHTRPAQLLERVRNIGVVEVDEDAVTPPSDLSGFASVHVQVLARDPSSEDKMFDPVWLRERSRLSAALGFPGGEGRMVDMYLVPRHFDQLPVQIWRHEAGNAGVERIDPVGNGDRERLERRYGALIEHFVGSALKTVIRSLEA